MASGVSVKSEAIKSGIGCCKTAIHELQTASRELYSGYQQAGSGGWKDQKYAALGGIVDECCSNLKNPIDDLQECIKNLNDLLQAVREYEQTNL